MNVDRTRLYESLTELGRIGAYRDDRLGIDGVCRLALTDADRDARELIRGWFEQAGLAVSVDAIGNLYGRREGQHPDLPPVMSGSHADSVPTAGRFDGALGILASLEVARTLNDQGVAAKRPFVCAVFTEEEGCRFGTDMLGSATAVGRIAKEAAWALQDRDGASVRDELQRIGCLGTAEPPRPHAFVELHIEQGPLLIRGGHDLGVVTGVQGISWFEISITGQSAHAGTTPVEVRRDAGLVASLLNVKLREMAQSGTFGEMRGTMGFVRPEPGAVNVIPGRVSATIDLRNPDDTAMARAEQALREYADEIAREHEVEIAWRQTAKTRAVPFDASIQDLIERHAEGMGLANRRLIAGAGHDAQEWATVCKTGMIFVPGEHDGISHNPRELSNEVQCGDGADVLLRVVLDLLDE